MKGTTVDVEGSDPSWSRSAYALATKAFTLSLPLQPLGDETDDMGFASATLAIDMKQELSDVSRFIAELLGLHMRLYPVLGMDGDNVKCKLLLKLKAFIGALYVVKVVLVSDLALVCLLEVRIDSFMTNARHPVNVVYVAPAELVSLLNVAALSIWSSSSKFVK